MKYKKFNQIKPGERLYSFDIIDPKKIKSWVILSCEKHKSKGHEHDENNGYVVATIKNQHVQLQLWLICSNTMTYLNSNIFSASRAFAIRKMNERIAEDVEKRNKN
jgi:hypothetical protein